jgi:hypothetical protein
MNGMGAYRWPDGSIYEGTISLLKSDAASNKLIQNQCDEFLRNHELWYHYVTTQLSFAFMTTYFISLAANGWDITQKNKVEAREYYKHVHICTYTLTLKHKRKCMRTQIHRNTHTHPCDSS